MTNPIKQFYEENPFPNDTFKTLGDLNIHSWLLKSLPEPIKKGSKILDAGCGTGEVSLFLSQFGDVTGIDFSENSISRAETNRVFYKIGFKQVEKIRFLQDDLVNLKHDEKYDYIFSMGVLHHIPDVGRAIDNLKNLLKPDGCMVLVVTNKYAFFNQKMFNPVGKWKGDLRWKDAYEHPYRKHYSQAEFKELLQDHNLEVVGMYKNLPDVIRLITGKNRLMNFCVKHGKSR